MPSSSSRRRRTNPAAAAAPQLVDKVIGAAERAFYSGLHTALLISACLLLASAAVVWLAFRGITHGASDRASAPSVRVRVLELAALVVVLVGAALGIEWMIGPSGGSAQAGSNPTTTTSAPPASGSPPTTRSPQIDVRPASGLHDKAQVHVDGSGFGAHTALVVVECADLGAGTSSADCDLSHVQPVTADAHGKVTSTVVVRTGPFGSAHRSCAPKHPCELTVSQPSAGPGAKRATASLSFAAGGTG